MGYPLTIAIGPKSNSGEEAIIGFSQLPYIDVVEQSKRRRERTPRTIALHDGAAVTLSIALTYDQQCRCIEATGVALDIKLPTDHLDAHGADQDW